MKRSGFARPEWKPGAPTSTFKLPVDKNGRPTRWSSFKPKGFKPGFGKQVDREISGDNPAQRLRSSTGGLLRPATSQEVDAGNVTTQQRSPGEIPAERTRTRGLKRSWMRQRPTRIKEGYEPKYRRFVRQFPCAVCSAPPPSQFCHERVKGTGLGLKSPDARGWPGCEEHHTDYDQRRGVFDGMDNDARKAWLDPKVADLRQQYHDAYGDEPELRERIAS